MKPRVMIYTPPPQEYNRESRMMKLIQFYRPSVSRWTLRCAAMAWLVLFGGASSVRPQEQPSPHTLALGQPVVREMRGGEQHTYQVNLSAGQYARIALD